MAMVLSDEPTQAELDAANPDIPAELTQEDCLQWLGEAKSKKFFRLVDNGQRLGQAWFNMLSVDDKDKVKDSPYDPFYKDTWPWVIESLRFLLEES
jgi:hypothetical protein